MDPSSLEALEAFEPLEDLDDEEFGLPSVEELPTLEDILGENPEVREDEFEEEDEPLEHNLSNQNGVWAIHNSSLLDSLSILSRGSRNSDQSRSRTSNSSKMSRRKPPEKEKLGSIMRLVDTKC